MSQLCFTSDLHLGHPLVARLRGYASTEEHDAALVRAWRQTVSKRDVVYILGDVTVGKDAYALDLLSQLPGTKHLISGNHDPSHPMHRRRARAAQRQYLEVFDSVQTMGVVQLHGERVLLSHFPYDADHDSRDREFDQWRLPDLGAPLLCGHVHDAWHVRGHQFNVGVDHQMQPWKGPHLRDWVQAARWVPVERGLRKALGDGLVSRPVALRAVRPLVADRPWLQRPVELFNVLTRDLVSVDRVLRELRSQ